VIGRPVVRGNQSERKRIASRKNCCRRSASPHPKCSWLPHRLSARPEAPVLEARPTSAPKAKPKRLRRRPDPFAAVTITLGNGSRQSRGIRRANCWSGCRLITPVSTRRVPADTAVSPKRMAPSRRASNGARNRDGRSAWRHRARPARQWRKALLQRS